MNKIQQLVENWVEDFTTEASDEYGVEVGEEFALRIAEMLSKEYKEGYNQCLKDQKFTGERWEHLYL